MDGHGRMFVGRAGAEHSTATTTVRETQARLKTDPAKDP